MINKISISLVILLQFCTSTYSQNWEGKYDKIGPYCSDCNLCAVKKEGKWGFADQKTGELVIPVQFDDVVLAPEFKGNYAWIRLNDKDGVIDINGRFIIPAKYDGIKREFKDDLALVSNYAKKGWANLKYGFVNTKGEEIIPLIYDNSDSFSEGYTSVLLGDKWGLIDTTGKIILPFKYDGISQIVFSGLVGVNKLIPGEIESSGTRMYSKYGVVDLKGNEIVPIKYNSTGQRFINGYLEVRNEDNKCGFVNTKGVEVVSCKYDDVNQFFEGFATVSIADKWSFINTSGKEIIPFKYDVLSSITKEGRIGFKWNNKYGFLDTKGYEIIPAKYDMIQNYNEGLAAVKLNNEWGYIDLVDKIVIPFQYAYADNFINGFAIVENLSGKWGYIDKTGKEIIPLIYDGVSNFENDIAQVFLNGKRLFLNKQGEQVEKKYIAK